MKNINKFIKYLILILVLVFFSCYATQVLADSPQAQLYNGNMPSSVQPYVRSLNGQVLNTQNMTYTDSMNAYMRNLYRSIQRNMNYKGDCNRSAVVKFRLMANGKTSYQTLVKSSNDKVFDADLLNAVKAFQYNPIDKDFKKSYLDIQIEASYKIN